jgi:hypothetical protein
MTMNLKLHAELVDNVSSKLKKIQESVANMGAAAAKSGEKTIAVQKSTQDRLSANGEKYNQQAKTRADRQSKEILAIEKKAALAEAALVKDKFDRRISVENAGHKITLDKLRDSTRAQEAEIRRHSAVVNRLQMDKANFPNTPFQQLLGKLGDTPLPAVGASLSALAVPLAAAAAGFTAMGLAGHFAYTQAREQADADNQLRAVLRSTGEAAGINFDQLQAMAGQLQETTDFTDDQAQSAEAVLLRYDRIGKDVFPRALKLTADLGQATGNLSGAAFDLGSALQSPAEGARKLRSMGVLLTQTQKDQLELWVKTGQEAKAQTFILDQVAKAYGGNAESMSHSTTRLKNHIGELAETLGGPLVKVVDKAAEAFLKLIKPGEEKQKTATMDSFYSASMMGLRSVDEQARKATLSLQSAHKVIAVDTPANKKVKSDDQIAAEKAARDKSDQVAADQAEIDAKGKMSSLKREEKYQEDLKRRREAAESAADEWSKRQEERSKKAAELDAKSKESLGSAKNADDQFALLEQQHQNEIKEYEGFKADQARIDEKYAILKDRLEKDQLKSTADGIAGNLKTVLGQYKSFGAAYKAVAQTQNAIDTFGAATAAYRSAASIPGVGFILGPVAAATAIAAGMANAAKIDSQGFQSGGWTGSGGNSDVAGVVHRNEVVWSQSDVARAGGVNKVESMRTGGGHSFSPVVNIHLSGTATDADAQKIAKATSTELYDLARKIKRIQYENIKV